MSGWDAVIPKISDDERKKVVEEVASQLNDMSLSEMRGDREKTRSAAWCRWCPRLLGDMVCRYLLILCRK